MAPFEDIISIISTPFHATRSACKMQLPDQTTAVASIFEKPGSQNFRRRKIGITVAVHMRGSGITPRQE